MLRTNEGEEWTACAAVALDEGEEWTVGRGRTLRTGHKE